MTAHWLTCCDGFRVEGGRRAATVERSVFDGNPLRPVALRVRVGSHRTSLVPVDAVEGICPIDRVVYLRRQPSAASTARRSAASAYAVAAPRARSAGRTAAAFVRARWPTVRRAAGVAAEAALVLALALAALAVSCCIALARLARLGFRAARRAAPHGARLAGDSLGLARRALR